MNALLQSEAELQMRVEKVGSLETILSQQEREMDGLRTALVGKQEEMGRVKEDHEAKIKELEKRVKSVIQHKDAQIGTAEKRVLEKGDQIRELEQMLGRQREELLGVGVLVQRQG